MNKSDAKLKEKLDQHYKFFDRSKISPDPLEFPKRFQNKNDIEISAFLSSLFAYGNVKQIMNSLNHLHSIMNWEPYGFVINYNNKKEGVLLEGFKHRFYTSDDVRMLFGALNIIYTRHGSLEEIFNSIFKEDQGDLKLTISLFSKKIIQLCSVGKETSHGIKFMFPNPLIGSACKRMNLFLRWMVRSDELDFGLWKEIPASKLIIPVDTHVAQICTRLKFTKSKNVSWKMAEEITNRLKTFDPIDPVKYDFAICHIGMRKMEF